MNLRERLAAARGELTPHTPVQTESVEPSTRTLSTEETSQVAEMFDNVYPSQESNTSNSSSAPIMGNDELSEMFGDLLPQNQELPEFEVYDEDEDEDEDFDDEDEVTEETPLPQPQIPEPEPEPQAVAAPVRRRSRISQEATSRFSGALWYDAISEADVTIIGAGGIGSWTSLIVSRLGVKSMTIYDDDVVELGNISGQLYSASDIDQFKVNAISNRINDFSVFHNITTIPEKFTSESYCTPVVIACLDSMTARRTAFNVWKRYVAGIEDKSKCLFIDGRLSAEVLQVYAVAGDDYTNMDRYESTLFNDSEADSEICSYKQTTFMANMIASVITNIFVNYIASGLDGGAAREVPFKTEYLGEMLWLKTEM